MPIEGYHLAFNGTGGRVEIRQYERQPWDAGDADEILVAAEFRDGRAHPRAAPARAAISAATRRCSRCCLRPTMADPLGQRAGAAAGALSVLTGVAAIESARRGVAIDVKSLL